MLTRCVAAQLSEIYNFIRKSKKAKDCKIAKPSVKHGPNLIEKTCATIWLWFIIEKRLKTIFLRLNIPKSTLRK